MGKMAVAVVMATMVIMVGGVAQKAQAQAQSPAPGPFASLTPILCWTDPRLQAPVVDAQTLINDMSKNAGQCCQNNRDVECTYLSTVGSVLAVLCAPPGWCKPCADLGNDLQQLLYQCACQYGLETVGGWYFIDEIGSNVSLGPFFHQLSPSPSPSPSAGG